MEQVYFKHPVPAQSEATRIIGKAYPEDIDLKRSDKNQVLDAK